MVDHLYVNSTRTDKLRIDFDFSFPQIACNLLALDAIDEAGIPQKDVVHELYKHKLDAFGQKDGLPKRHKLGGTMTTEDELHKNNKHMIQDKNATKIPKGCGNCYGAGSKGDCCNTCDEVKHAYTRSGWKFNPLGVSQCATENEEMNKRDESAEDGGCQLYGHLELNKAFGGHFHVAPHKQLKPQGGDSGILTLWDLIFFTFEQFNITHTINSLSFGDQFPGIKSPLDGQSRSLEDTHGMYQYFIKVVPTRYQGLHKKEIESNQYSVTEHMRHLSPGSGKGLPGLYFYYEVSPVQAIFEERRKNKFLSFLTNVCAIVGGAFSVMGIVDVLVSYSSKFFWKDVFRGTLA